MNSASKAQLERLGPVRDVSRVSYGSAGEARLIPAHGDVLRKVTAALALVKRGLSMREARDAVDQMVEQGEATVALPMIEDTHSLAVDLAASGIVGEIWLEKVRQHQHVHQRGS
ncbi:hypothetical protein CR162_21195 [Pseudoroseomonas rhizosphaerae]|uniref:Uncharacterized protein n=1 Tax=Teichococcus rhizosphaerae TaxID=1335062 RepID=A0A2C7A3M9_9PROT|nr:hypothetical protein [Pseudoroseomonas rhizosphaerae]PHK92950.1 hypothetical protein CR162_21195 [Pseudoroseomonas rhizosphaerae]